MEGCTHGFPRAACAAHLLPLFFCPATDTFITRPARELLWGYTDPVLNSPLVKALIAATGQHVSPFIQLQANNTNIYTKFSEVYTGKVRHERDLPSNARGRSGVLKH